MKKLIMVLLAMLMLVSLAGCNKKEEAIEEDKPETTEEPVVGPVVGGWTIYNEEPQAQTTQEGMEAMEKALAGLTGVGYKPFIELGTQVVSGINYMYLTKMTTVTPDAPVDLGVVVVYKDLQGNASLKNTTKLDLAAMTEVKDENFPETKDLVGGFTLNEGLVEGTLPEDAKKAFDTCVDGLLGVNYTPIALLGTKVVSGTEYAILATRQVVAPDQKPALCVMFIYADLNNGAELNSVYPINLADYNG